MRISYDEAADGAYISLSGAVDATVASTYLCDPIEVSGMINLDFDEKRVLIGIEVMGASKRLPAELFRTAELIGRGRSS